MDERWWSSVRGSEWRSLFWDCNGVVVVVVVDVESVAGLQDVSVGGKAVLLLLFLIETT